ncbi:hypothetical protein [Prosthecobacter sp.]|uniref:hypothetical protein n=1 Tax=Prosthecobacter sp. TaxID=1965333 RepID=UPI003784ACBD
MPDAPLSSASSQRKVIAMAALAFFAVTLGLAFVLTGKKAHVASPADSSDTQIGTLINLAAVDLNSQATPEDWFDGMPDGAEARRRPTVEPSSTGKAPSSIVTGDNNAPAAPPVTAPPAAPPTHSGPQQGKPATPAVAVVTPPSHGTERPAAATSGPAHASASPAAATAPSSTATKPAGHSSAPAVARADKASKPREEESRPVFVPAARKLPGLIAQTLTLITEGQFHPGAKTTPPPSPAPPSSQDSPQAAVPLAIAASEEPVPKAIPVHVLHEEARVYAAETTQQLQQKGTLSLSEHIRLPKRTEAANASIWHDEDKPLTAGERRPFGLVLSNEKSAFTPEGIPLRTDIPAGTSPLEKTGADKPLWKRPQ